MEIFFSVILIIGLSAIGIYISETYNKSNKETPIHDNLTKDEEIIALLRNIAENQRKIKTNTTIITIIMMVPIIISIIILLLNIKIIDSIIQNII